MAIRHIQVEGTDKGQIEKSWPTKLQSGLYAGGNGEPSEVFLFFFHFFFSLIFIGV